MTKKNIKYFLIVLLSLFASLSVLHAFRQAQIYSYDIHISPAKLVSEGINHYQYILDGKRDYSSNDKLVYAQNGEYAQGMYILLIPLALLDWESAKLLWSIINILLSILIPLLLCKKFKLNFFNSFLIITIFLMSTVFRIHISYGQQSLFVFLFFLLPLLYQSRIFILLGGISYFKYHIGYGLFLYFLTLRNISVILISIIPCIIGWLTYSYLTHTEIIKNLFQPLLTVFYYASSESHYPVTIFSYLKKINIDNSFIYLIQILLNFFFILKSRFIIDELHRVSLIFLSVLAFTPHQLHDYVLLLPLLVFSVKNSNLLISLINLVFIFYFFFFLRVLSYFFLIQPWQFPQGYFGYFNNLLTLLVFLINFMNAKFKKNNNFI